MSFDDDLLDVESLAYESFRSYLKRNKKMLKFVAEKGDGQCGALLKIMQEVLEIRTDAEQKVYQKKAIPNKLRTAVFERDMYRCVRCGSHKQLCADHIVPEVKGGDATMDNLQTLCRPCNTKKGWK